MQAVRAQATPAQRGAHARQRATRHRGQRNTPWCGRACLAGAPTRTAQPTTAHTPHTCTTHTRSNPPSAHQTASPRAAGYPLHRARASTGQAAARVSPPGHDITSTVWQAAARAILRPRDASRSCAGHTSATRRPRATTRNTPSRSAQHAVVRTSVPCGRSHAHGATHHGTHTAHMHNTHAKQPAQRPSDRKPPRGGLPTP